MRKSIAFKTLLRSPLKTILTFLLIAAASFALFSRVTDYVVTTREAAKAESFYSGVAALDNSVPEITVEQEIEGVMWMNGYVPDYKPWPTDAQIEEFSSLPGVTLADTRYMTAGQIGDYKRLKDKDDNLDMHDVVLEGTYEGYEELDEGYATLVFDDVTVHAGEFEVNSENPTRIRAIIAEELGIGQNPYPLAFFEKLEKGSRCLVMANTGWGQLELNNASTYSEECFRVIDGLGDDYLETEDFAFYKWQIEAIRQSLSVYDIVYTSDMRAIPRFNERKLVINEGRPLTVGDADGCVVSKDFLETYGLSIGDSLHIELGDKLFSPNYYVGATPLIEKQISNFVDTVDLEIVGAYSFADSYMERCAEDEWSYTPSTVFVPSSLLPVEVPDDYETTMGNFSVFIENAHDIEVFRKAAEPLVGEMGLGLRFSDGGWTSMKDNFKTGSLASFLTTVLYVLGSALALLLAVYLYIGRNQKSYAIMRTLGVSGKKARNSVALPLLIVSVFAMPIGGITGLFYASYTAARTLATMSTGTAPKGYAYVLDATLPIGAIILCFVFELAFLLSVTLLFLRKMKKTPPLELLQEGVHRAGAGTKVAQELVVSDAAAIPAGLDIEKISVIDESAAYGKYGAFCQVTAYILRHMRRGIGKTAVSLVLAAVLTAGIGTFVLARLAYQEAFQEIVVKGKAWDFASTSVVELSKSDLVKDFYYYNQFSVRVNGTEIISPVVATNDFDHYLTDDYKVTYAKGLDGSVFEGTGAVCLVGQTLADAFDIQPGEIINLMSEDLYSFMLELYEDKSEEQIQAAIEQAGNIFTVAGILKSADEDANSGIFVAANEATDKLYGQPYPVAYCEFTLTDNERLDELNTRLDELKKQGMKYSTMGLFSVDSESFENIKRIHELLESLFPIAVAAAVLIGLFGPGLVIMQSAQEAAFLRVLGVTKKRARCMLVFEQVILCSAATALVAIGLVLFRPGLFARSIETLFFCWMLYFLGCVCGALAAAVQVTRYKVLELLQVKE